MIQDQTADRLIPRGPRTLVPVRKMPWVPGLFTKLLALSVVRSSELPPETHLENICLVFKNYAIDREKLRNFNRVCGYHRDKKTLPAPFVQTLFIGLVSKFIGSPYFPITPMGLIQVGQSFELKQPLDPDTPLDLFCSLLDMTQTDRGIHTRFLMEASPPGTTDETPPAWQGTATYFTRAKQPGSREKTINQEIPLPLAHTIRAAENTGRRYAAVSGDYNPHHLYGWTARFIGFKRAIAHGMWSLARTCALLEKEFNHPEALEINGQFKLPIFLPSTISLGIDAQKDGARFELRDEAMERPHLKGSFRF